MVINRPTIIIYCKDADKDLLREVCAGIEEEGVLYQTEEREGDLDSLAFDAAKESMLGSGVGILGNALPCRWNMCPRGKMFLNWIRLPSGSAGTWGQTVPAQ